MSYPIDPELAPIIDFLPRLNLEDIEGTRAALADPEAPPFEPNPDVAQETLSVPADGGRPAVDLLVLRPAEAASTPRPLVVWFHGGGFVMGDAQESLPFLERVVRETGAVATSVQYRLAPETRYPGAVDDGVAAMLWLLAHADELGVDATRVGVGGQSAGAAVALGATLRLRDSGGPVPTHLVLEMPTLDDRLATASARAYEDTPMWDRGKSLLSWREYLGESGTADAYAAPARAGDLVGLPPVFLGIAQFDALRDEALEFASRLALAGVPTEAHLYPGTFHISSAMVPDASVSRRQVADLVAAFAGAF